MSAQRAATAAQAIRDDLHALVDQLSEEELDAARLFLEYLRGGRCDPVLLALATAPWDDEPETEEERAAVAQARASVAAGRTISTEELRRRLGL